MYVYIKKKIAIVAIVVRVWSLASSFSRLSDSDIYGFESGLYGEFDRGKEMRGISGVR